MDKGQIEPGYGWACVGAWDGAKPWIAPWAVKRLRADAQREIAEFFVKDDETWQRGWKRAYGQGWRCIRVVVKPAFEQ